VVEEDGLWVEAEEVRFIEGRTGEGDLGGTPVEENLLLDLELEGGVKLVGPEFFRKVEFGTVTFNEGFF